jgi:hypothetical protein
MKAFTADIDDLQRVKVGRQASPGEDGTPVDSDEHVIPLDEDQPGSDEGVSPPGGPPGTPGGGEGPPGDGEGPPGTPGRGEGPPGTPGRGEGPPGTPGKGGIPVIDIIPGGASTSEGLPGSDKKGGTPFKPADIKKTLEGAEEHEATANQGGVGAGTGAGGGRVAVGTDFPTHTDWARVLINLLEETKLGDPSWAEIHKPTFGTKIKGRSVMIAGKGVEEDIGKIIVAIDTSGSISDDIVSVFLSDLKRIFDTFRTSESFACKVILWAHQPYAVSKDFTINQFNQLKQWVSASFRTGGTAIDPVVQLINSLPNKKEYVGTIWFTDGQINDLRTKLLDNYNIFVINGFSSEYTKEFLNDLKKYKPSKQITIVKTSIGYGS